MADSLNLNISNSSLALQAVNYTNAKLDIGSSNKLSTAYWGNPAKRLCVDESRDHVTKDLADLTRQRARSGGPNVGWADQVDASADWAKHYGCGNCGEYSAVAFVYLRDVLKIRPLDWMDYGNFQHAFVLVGRASGSAPTQSEESFEPSAMKNWSSNTILCDAYNNDVLDFPHMALMLSKYSSIRLLHRVE